MKQVFLNILFFMSFVVAGMANAMNAQLPSDGSVFMCDQKNNHNFPSTRDVHGRKLFVFDPRAHAWGAYNRNGYLIAVGKASGGADYCKDIGRSCRTVTGKFTIFRKQGAGCVSSAYPKRHDGPDGGAEMPYCMHFYKGYAIHASKNVPNKNVSHGCIRVTHHCAQYLNENFINIGTKVLILPYSRVGRVLWNMWEKVDAMLL